MSWGNDRTARLGARPCRRGPHHWQLRSLEGCKFSPESETGSVLRGLGECIGAWACMRWLCSRGALQMCMAAVRLLRRQGCSAHNDVDDVFASETHLVLSLPHPVCLVCHHVRRSALVAGSPLLTKQVLSLSKAPARKAHSNASGGGAPAGVVARLVLWQLLSRSGIQ